MINDLDDFLQSRNNASAGGNVDLLDQATVDASGADAGTITLTSGTSGQMNLTNPNDLSLTSALIINVDNMIALTPMARPSDIMNSHDAFNEVQARINHTGNEQQGN